MSYRGTSPLRQTGSSTQRDCWINCSGRTKLQREGNGTGQAGEWTRSDISDHLLIFGRCMLFYDGLAAWLDELGAKTAMILGPFLDLRPDLESFFCVCGFLKIASL